MIHINFSSVLSVSLFFQLFVKLLLNRNNYYFEELNSELIFGIVLRKDMKFIYNGSKGYNWFL